MISYFKKTAVAILEPHVKKSIKVVGHKVMKAGVWLDTFRSHMLLDEIHERDEIIMQLRKRNASLENTRSI